MNDIVVVKEQQSSVVVKDQDLNIPVSIIEEAIQAGPEQDNVVVEQKDDFLLIKSIQENIKVDDQPDILDLHFSEVLINNNTLELPADLEMPYAQQVDFVNEDVIYKGWAETGTITSLPLWRIQKITFVGTDEDVTIEWADGNGNFDNVWDSRAGLTYT